VSQELSEWLHNHFSKYDFNAIPTGVRSRIVQGKNDPQAKCDSDLQRILHSLHGGDPDQVAVWQKCLAKIAQETSG
jgi:hypothetical protein